MDRDAETGKIYKNRDGNLLGCQRLQMLLETVNGSEAKAANRDQHHEMDLCHPLGTIS